MPVLCPNATTWCDSPWTLAFWCQRFRQNSNGITPTRASNTSEVGWNRWFSTNNYSSYFLHLRNDTRYGHCYYTTNANRTVFSTFCMAFHIFMTYTGGDRDLKFVRYVDHTEESYPVDRKQSLKGRGQDTWPIKTFTGRNHIFGTAKIVIPCTHHCHRLRGSASPVLTATGFVNGKGQFSIDTPQPITEKFVTGDYVGDPYGVPNKVHIRPRGASGHMGEI